MNNDYFGQNTDQNTAQKPPETTVEQSIQTNEMGPSQTPYTSTPEIPVVQKETMAEEPKKIILADILAKNKKTILISSGAVLLAGITIAGAMIFFGNQPIELVVSANQTPFSLTANGRTYTDITSPTTIKLQEGTYTMVAEKEGYLRSTRQITVSKQNKGSAVNFEFQEEPLASPVVMKNALFPVYSSDTNALLYFTKDDTGYSLVEYKIDTQTETVVTNRKIASISNVAWSRNRNQLAITTVNSSKNTDNLFPYLEQYGEDTTITWVVTLDRKDLVNVGLVSLNPSIKNVSFSPEGDKIVYFFDGVGEKVIAVANNDGSNYERIMRLESVVNPEVSWSPDGSKIAIFPKRPANPDEQARSEKNDLYTYNFSTSSLSKISDSGNANGAVWSNDGTKIIYENDGSLWLTIMSNGENKNHDLGITGDASMATWINNSMAAIGKDQEVTVININTDGNVQKNDLPMNNNSLDGNIQKILAGDNTLYVITAAGVYTIPIVNSIN